MSEKKIQRVSAREGYDLWSETYDETPNPVVSMDSRHTLRLLSPRHGERMLDAGCGTGRSFKPILLAGSRLVAIDFSLGMLKVARRNYPAVPLALADLEQPLPFRPSWFDAVLCALIGEHLKELRLVLQELYAVLKPGGRFVFSVYHPAMAAAGKEARFEQLGVQYRLGAYRYSIADYRQLLEEVGFLHLVQHEFSGDEQLVESVPWAVKLLNFPILLIFEASRASTGD